jgi:hypothetical protein
MLHIDDLCRVLLLLSFKSLVSFMAKYQVKTLFEMLCLESTLFKQDKAIICRQFITLS